jgi:hypothetical protein
MKNPLRHLLHDVARAAIYLPAGIIAALLSVVLMTLSFFATVLVSGLLLPSWVVIWFYRASVAWVRAPPKEST